MDACPDNVKTLVNKSWTRVQLVTHSEQVAVLVAYIRRRFAAGDKKRHVAEELDLDPGLCGKLEKGERTNVYQETIERAAAKSRGFREALAAAAAVERQPAPLAPAVAREAQSQGEPPMLAGLPEDVVALFVDWLSMTKLPRPVSDKAKRAALGFVMLPGGVARRDGRNTDELEQWMQTWHARGGDEPRPEPTTTAEGSAVTDAGLERAKKKGGQAVPATPAAQAPLEPQPELPGLGDHDHAPVRPVEQRIGRGQLPTPLHDSGLKRSVQQLALERGEPWRRRRHPRRPDARAHPALVADRHDRVPQLRDAPGQHFRAGVGVAQAQQVEVPRRLP